MDMPRIEIQQRFAKIGLNSKPPVMKVKQPASDLEIRQEPGELKIDTELIDIKVDGYPARYDLGYRNIADLSKDIVRKGKKSWLAMISHYTRAGDRLMDFQKHGIAEIVSEETSEEPVRIGLKFKRGPEYEVKPHQIQMKYKPQRPVFNSGVNHVDIRAKWGKVNVTMEQYEKIEIDVVGNMVNQLV